VRRTVAHVKCHLHVIVIALYSQTGCSLASNVAILSNNIAILIGRLLWAICNRREQIASYCGTILQCCSQENIRFDCNPWSNWPFLKMLMYKLWMIPIHYKYFLFLFSKILKIWEQCYTKAAFTTLWVN
jgi:hypothetical protein